MKKRTLFILLFVFSLLVLVGCLFRAPIRALWALTGSTDHFLVLREDNRVYYETGSVDLAKRISKDLTVTVPTIEKRLGGRFLKPIRIYVCESQKSFTRFSGAPAQAMGASNSLREAVFISPKINEDYGTFRNLIGHELVHLHESFIKNIWATARIPPWFQEGLATFVSDGGGALPVTEKEAIEAIRSGGRVKFDAHWSLFGSGGIARSDGMKPRMAYRQAGMFIVYLSGLNPASFSKLLQEIRDGTDFQEAFRRTYGSPIETLAGNFFKSVGS